MKSNELVLQAEIRSFRYGAKQPEVLQDIFINVSRGRITGVTGASGCGKSTLAHVLCGMIPHGVKGVLDGKVLVCYRDAREFPLPELSKKVCIVLQQVEDQLFMPTVEEEIAFALENFCCPEDKIEAEVSRMLKFLNIEHLRKRNPSALSGGEKRVVAVGAVLSLNPQCIILDEPFAGLDESNCMLLHRVIGELKAIGKAVILIEHQPEHLEVTDVLHVMSEGRIAKRLEGAGIHEFLQSGLSEFLLPKTAKDF